MSLSEHIDLFIIYKIITDHIVSQSSSERRWLYASRSLKAFACIILPCLYYHPDIRNEVKRGGA